METLEQLVKERRGYKYLSKSGVSPYQNYQYDLNSRKQMKANELDHDENNECGEGWNLATLKWIADNCMKVDGIIVECSIPKSAIIVVPEDSDGKFRTDIIKIKKIHSIESLFPALKDFAQKLKNYKPINPITAEVMPDVESLKKIMASVRASVGDSVRDSVRDSVGASVWDSVGDSVRASVGDSVGASVRASVRDSVGASVRASVGDYSYICGCFAIKEFFNLEYEHPVFDLIRMGVMVIIVNKKAMVYGKYGKFLGEFKL